MKNVIGILVLLIVSTSAFASDTISVKPDLKVMAKSGLKLRLTPSLEAPVLAVLHYGAEVSQSNDFVPSKTKFKVNWVEGSWIKVNYDNQEGFVFDGFLSELEVPEDENEFASGINDISYALYHWAHYNFPLRAVDTLTSLEHTLTTISLLGDHELFVHDTEYMTKVEMTLENVRIMDVYHLLESMMDTRSARSILKENTMFFAGADGKVNKLKIAEGQIVIKKIKNGQVKVSCQTIHEGC